MKKPKEEANYFTQSTCVCETNNYINNKQRINTINTTYQQQHQQQQKITTNSLHVHTRRKEENENELSTTNIKMMTRTRTRKKITTSNDTTTMTDLVSSRRGIYNSLQEAELQAEQRRDNKAAIYVYGNHYYYYHHHHHHKANCCCCHSSTSFASMRWPSTKVVSANSLVSLCGVVVLFLLCSAPPSTSTLQQQNQVPSSEASAYQFVSSTLDGAQSSDVETFYIRKGSNGTLPCLPADNHASSHKIEWYKEEKKLVEAESKHINVWNTKNTIAYLPETGALLFRGVTNEDSGEYHCILTKQPDNNQEGGIVRFYVQDVPDAPQKPITMSFSSRSVNISWAPSFDYHYSPILHYIIHIREGENGTWNVANGIMTPDNRTQYQIIGLKPFTTYSFRVSAVNSIGPSEPSVESYYIMTLREIPDGKPTIVSAHNISSNSVRIEWLPPSHKEIHGEFLGYRIRYVPRIPTPAPPFTPNNYNGNNSGSVSPESTSNNINTISQQQNPSAQSINQPDINGPLAKELIVGDHRETSLVVKNLETFTQYLFSVQVFNPAGDGPSSNVLVMTDEGVSSPPTNLSVMRVADTSVKLRWMEPKYPNGIIQGYQIFLQDLVRNLNDTRRLSDPQSIMEHTIGDLRPFSHYKLWIQAYSRKFQGESSAPVKIRTDVQAPSAPVVINLTCYSSDSIFLQWERPQTFYNQIDYYFVYYKLEGQWNFEEIALSAKKDKVVNELLVTNLTADSLYEIKVRAATKSTIDGNLLKSEFSDPLKVILQSKCESYTVYPSMDTTINASLLVGVICASFALALVIVSFIMWRKYFQAAYYYLDDPPSATRGNSPQLSETYDGNDYGSTPISDWSKHVQKLHADGDIGFSREYEEIQKATNLNLSCEHSQMPENKHKNRYINIVAYDHSRVLLRQIPGQKKPGSDYINANFIDGYNKPRAYIGTQGPLPSTFDDYWRMIWEQRVVIIVMITNLQERGRRKCDMYWPKEGTETYGHIQVKLLQEVVMATYTLRTFTAKNLKIKKKSGSERTVYQYHYTNWPDHGVPDHPLPVLSFVKKSASANPPGAGAIICHCSAGCGRSGTYVVIDAMLKQIRHRQSINVVDFLKHIRSQRNYLVQTEEQYIFIHDALVEAIESGETEVASTFIGKYIQTLQTGGLQSMSSYSLNGTTTNTLLTPQQQINQSASQNNLLTTNDINVNKQQLTVLSGTHGPQSSPSSMLNGNGQTHPHQQQWSLLDRQYKLVASFKAKDYNVVSALKPCNKHKNRTMNLIPLEAHRVHITPKPGTDGSDYINATFLMGFNHLREFIITQHPVYETFSDFWQMVYDHNSQTIVLLTSMSDLKDYPQFWPQKEDEVDYGSFKVKLTAESTLITKENSGVIVTRDFIMRSTQDDYELQCRVIHCPGWPEVCGPLSGVFNLIQVVQNSTATHHSQGNNASGQSVTIGQDHETQNGGPVIVVDRFGGTEAATFAVLTTLYKQYNFEFAVDVYMYAKLAHLRRPGIWRSQDDYLFLYRAIENLASTLNSMSGQGQPSAIDQASSDISDRCSPYNSRTGTLQHVNSNNHLIGSSKHATPEHHIYSPS